MAGDTREAALCYASRKIPVFPLNGKKPLTEHGFKDATTDPEKISGWWSQWPDANVGVPTGSPSGLVVLDVDPRAGGDKSLAALEKTHGMLPATLESHTGGGGRHLFFSLCHGQDIRNSASKLGAGLDVRGEGGYVVVPPSRHPDTTNQYAWTNKLKPGPVPAWLIDPQLAVAAPRKSNPGAAIPSGQRNATLTSLAGTMRRRGMSSQAIEAALLTENAQRCDPPLSEPEVKEIAGSVARYAPDHAAKNAPLSSPWAADTMDVFLNDSLDDEAKPLYERILYRETITEIFSPRGIGKSLFANYLAVHLARNGFRVLLLDRDNPRRLRGWGAVAEPSTLKAITREKCPPLTNASAWGQFPYLEFDVVILDSLDSMAEGIGEQDSTKPSRAIAPVLDIARREGGPAVLILGNCVRTGSHSRGSGVIEDRADIVFEVRDATGFRPSGKRAWFEELPPADAGSWANRASRRKKREVFRLAFISTKFRIGEEPEPFVIEIDTTTHPWTMAEVTDSIDQEGAAEREKQAQQRATAIKAATELLKVEIRRREEKGESVLLRKQAEEYLTSRGIKQKIAREAIHSPEFETVEVEGKGHPKGVRLAGKNNGANRNAALTEPSVHAGSSDGDFGCPHPEHSTEIAPNKTQYPCGSQDGVISVGPSLFTPSETSSDDEVVL